MVMTSVDFPSLPELAINGGDRRQSKAESNFDGAGFPIVLGPDDKKIRAEPPEEFRMTRERRVPRIASVDGWMDVAFTG